MGLVQRNIKWFIKKYPNEDERYVAICNYLLRLLEEKDCDSNGKSELLDFIRHYTIKKTGLDPHSEAMKI